MILFKTFSDRDFNFDTHFHVSNCILNVDVRFR